MARHEGVRSHRYKLIHYYGTGDWELFDLENDPNEMKSVYDDLEYGDVRSLMKGRLPTLREGYKVPELD